MRARKRLKPKIAPSKHVGTPLCSAPVRVKGRLHPCENTAVVVVSPDGQERPLCAKHFKDFTDYYEDSDETRPTIKHL